MFEVSRDGPLKCVLLPLFIFFLNRRASFEDEFSAGTQLLVLKQGRERFPFPQLWLQASYAYQPFQDFLYLSLLFEGM